MSRVRPPHATAVPFTVLVAVALGAGASACGSDDDPATGTLDVTIYGEAFIEEGIPASVFSDGWAVSFDQFLVSVGEVTAASGHDAAAVNDATYRVFDLAQSSAGAGHAVFSAEVPAGAYDHVGYRIAPPPTGAVVGNATAADLAALTSANAALHVRGSATKGAVTKTFAWSFATKTRYGHCESTAVVAAGARARSQLTIHADHLFYDDLFAEEPNVAFDLVAAADADADGAVTQAELAAQDITGQTRYQVGSTGIANLWDFIAYQTGTVGHIDGEGHCEDATRE